MRTSRKHRFHFACWAIAAFPALAPHAAPVDFQREIRPILSQHCFGCHGPDEGARQGGVRLDHREFAHGKAKSGRTVIVPGAPEQSELIRRIGSDDPSERMPPPEAKSTLSDRQKDLLRAWIAAGAEFQEHWAFIPPRKSPLPEVKDQAWPQNPIDHFTLARMEAAGVEPSPQADRAALIRRLYLDFVGYGPSVEAADEFLNDPAPDAYERAVDALLASPHYGERWARRWLDLARYADTNGYEKDRPRSIWPYRDWVIRALNADMPFDQFSIEQLAGDLLPDATLDQRVATGFHRNTMLNEEGGIDPLEFRYYAVVDRVATTSEVWLGLTVGCAQCHTHKYDPVSQREYYQFMSFLNNADEPELTVPRADIAAKRASVEKRIEALIQALPEKFPATELEWRTGSGQQLVPGGGQTVERLEDSSFRVTGPNPDTDAYRLTIQLDAADALPSGPLRIDQLRIEALADSELPNRGPGRTPHGNFVLTELRVSAIPRGHDGEPIPIRLARASADFAQNGFPANHAIDGNSKTGWAIHGEGKWNVNRTATFHLEEPLSLPDGGRLNVELEQAHGEKHTLGRVRVSLGIEHHDSRPLEVRRKERFNTAFEQWLDTERAANVEWTPIRPDSADSNLPLLTLLDDDSIFASGDQTKSDTYRLRFNGSLEGIRALRIETIPDERLPRGGPGRVDYEGPIGDFTLSEFRVRADGQAAQIARATESFASGGFTAAAAIDGNPQTGWSINGGQGREHAAVFQFATPLAAARELEIEMLFERHFAAGLGRFRIWATRDDGAKARPFPIALEPLLATPPQELTEDQQFEIERQFVLTAPELESARAEINRLRQQMPAFPTTLVMQERPSHNPRPTRIYHRGEFLQPREEVQAGVPEVLHPFPADAPRNRLEFARWLVSPESPLAARVTVNRQWAAFFGRGLVRTEADFGSQGEMPTHSELLDWLAVEFVEQGWSLKNLHKRIVMSATYRQSSDMPPGLDDPDNRLLARGPRVRLEAELIRDSTLHASGLLAQKVGGPSVFPPQPANVTTEGAYGRLDWKVSEGTDRYRRGLYTFSKRTAPYAMFATFDGPSGEACIVQREVSNTPLQALTMLNDGVLMEAAQALGRTAAQMPGPAEERMISIFRRCFTRMPSPFEMDKLLSFLQEQQLRFEEGALDSALIAGVPKEAASAELGAWVVLARALLNLDEMITKN